MREYTGSALDAGLLGMLERRYKADMKMLVLCILAAVSAGWCLQVGP